MIWQSYESQEPAILDEPMVGQLKSYLEKKEFFLSSQIINAIHLDRSLSSTLSGVPPSALRLNEAVEELGKKVHLLSQMDEPKAISPQWEAAAKQINDALWSYVEVFEGSVIELYQQIDQIGFEHWDIGMSRAVTAIRDELTHRIDDLMWAIRRLEQQLKAYRSLFLAHQKNWVSWCKAYFFCPSLIDASLTATMRKCQKFLNFRYGQFIDRYKGYVQLDDEIEKSLHEFDSPRSISLTNLNMWDRFEQFYRALNLWALNRTAKTLPQRETIRAVRRVTPQANALALFQSYLQAIRKALFEQSRLIKRPFPIDAEGAHLKQDIYAIAASIRAELGMLKQTMAKYLKFMLETTPSPHSKWRINKWFFKPDSKAAKHLQALIHQSEQLDKLSAELQLSLESEQIMEHRLTPQFENEVNHHLHEMGQPLASKDLMRRHAKIVLNRLKSLDELGAFHTDVVDYICHTLCRLLLVDWKYHVLQDFPSFYRIYEIHYYIAAQDDRIHTTRLNKFRHLIHQLEQWIASRHSLNHTQDIELDINDIKAYLQDFLAHIQRMESAEESWKKERFAEEISRARHYLLEYLFVFGNFFHKLHHDDPEQWLLRKQLLFVSQYFEAIHGKLHDLAEEKSIQ